MSESEKNSNLPPDLFEATRWSVVLRAKQTALGSACHRALSELCQAYWFPVYAYLRRKGYDQHKAEDLAQGFFAKLLAQKGYAKADPNRGKFRAFLITSLKNFVHNERDREHALKRGGGVKPVELDAGEGEERYAMIATEGDDLEIAFDREWAVSVVSAALKRLRDEYVADGRELLFEHLQNGISHPGQQLSQADLAERLEMSEGAVKSSLQRLRKRYRWILRQEIAQTTESPDDVDDEIRYLLECLRST